MLLHIIDHLKRKEGTFLSVQKYTCVFKSTQVKAKQLRCVLCRWEKLLVTKSYTTTLFCCSTVFHWCSLYLLNAPGVWWYRCKASACRRAEYHLSYYTAHLLAWHLINLYSDTKCSYLEFSFVVVFFFFIYVMWEMLKAHRLLENAVPGYSARNLSLNWS